MPDFPRDKQWRTAQSRMAAYRALSPIEPIPVSLHEVTHEDQTYRFRYVVRVTTINNETGDPVTRHVSLTDDNRFMKDDLLGAARDLVMDSPVSSNETFDNAEIVFALRQG